MGWGDTDDDAADRDDPQAGDLTDGADEAAEMLCPRCGVSVTEDTPKCPRCGEWITPVAAAGRGWRRWVFVGVVLLMAALMLPQLCR